MIKTNKFGEMIFDEDEIFDQVMSGQPVNHFENVLVHPKLDLETAALILEDVPKFIEYNELVEQQETIEQFDHRCQSTWHMPDQYKQLDIAKHVLELCSTDAELQRVGEELLLFQERNLFDLLRYLKYLVDVMRENRLIWGVGRGSSLASYVLYLLGVHRINSMFYDLDPQEFLR
jgi:DNA polymerase III alpha subunit